MCSLTRNAGVVTQPTTVAQKSSQMFLPFQSCVFAEAHAMQRFAATGPVAAATRKTIRGPGVSVENVTLGGFADYTRSHHRRESEPFGYL
ncbi:hypothetical protein PUN28_012661 [Cardiocondyla obscurior]|uniref:Uncharacterized protein n=1 Tax=Cardiocondyla obscurior TaxID=286306 RepID=A0AAW2FDT5_9HYME